MKNERLELVERGGKPLECCICLRMVTKVVELRDGPDDHEHDVIWACSGCLANALSLTREYWPAEPIGGGPVLAGGVVDECARVPDEIYGKERLETDG